MQYLYLIGCNEYYKIGVALDVNQRLAQLSTGNPYPLKLLSAYAFSNAEPVERAIHQRFDSKRERGEWFALSEMDILNFGDICKLLGGDRCDSPTTLDDVDFEEAEEVQETQDILLGGVNWRLDRRPGRGYAIFQRGGEKKYIGYAGKKNLKDWEHPTIEEIEMIISKNGAKTEAE